ncbi:type 2 lanthipeptide synthetase LanM [Enterococcus casseliflavus]|uniref:type 2 lanthipeptide synthetase LanM n=1 Tax=Enterococcus casseliflavus TaxID=37734 RepID=UPI0034D16D94
MDSKIDLMKTKTIAEKMTTYTDSKDVDTSYLDEWRSSRTLLTEKYFETMLNHTNISYNQFAYALQPMENHQDAISEDGWLELFYKIIDDFDYTNINYELGVLIPAYPFSNYLKTELINVVKNINNFQISQEVLDAFVGAHLVEMFEIIGKVVALKLEEFKQSNLELKNCDIFLSFLCSVFKSKESFLNFFREYPVLARVSTVRTKYLIKNYIAIIQNIDNDYLEIQKFLGVDNLYLKGIDLSTGDSHEQGNSVSILKFDDMKLVYKPKNLEISQAFEKFINWYTNNSDLLKLKIPSGIYKENYTYNEYIEQFRCENELQIENYYERYGYLIAICYLFSLNDLHIENIVAHGEYPVIIDIETIFQVPNQIEGESLYFDLLRNLELESVNSSFLLPTKLKIGEEDNIDLSALSGQAVELNQKILGPVEINTEKFHYKKVPSYFNGGNNIPKSKDFDKVDYKKYVFKIIQGFDDFIEFTRENKEEFIKTLSFFKRKKTRVLLKGTEKYVTMIRYSNHPAYNCEMKYRERLMMNLWAYPYKDKRVVNSEVRDLIYNDVPIFYSYSDSRDLIDSQGHIYEKYLKTSGLKQSIDRINNLSDEIILRQRSLLLSSLKMWDKLLNSPPKKKELIFETQNFDLVLKSKYIAKLLESEMIMKNEQTSILSIDCSENKHWKIVPVDESLYSGISGIALYFLELYKISEEDKYLNLYKKSINTAIMQCKVAPLSGAFEGWLSPLYPMILESKYLGTVSDSDFFEYTIKKLSEMTLEQIRDIEEVDYISGLSGIVRLLSIANTIFPSNLFISKSLENFSTVFLEKVEQNNQNTLDEIGIAHGISGVMLGVASSSKRNSQVNYVKEQLAKEFDLFNSHKNNYKWCWGLSGMIQSRLEILKKSPQSIDRKQLNILIREYLDVSEKMIDEDSLCHGNGSVISTMKMIFDYTEDNHWEKLLAKWISNLSVYAELEGYNIPVIGDISIKGLFDGLSGIGWMYLYIDHSISNVLLLEG